MPIVKLFTREALNYTLIIGLLIPVPQTAFGQVPAIIPQQPSRVDAEKAASAAEAGLNKLSRLVNEINLNPNAADVDKKIATAVALTSALDEIISPEVPRINEQLLDASIKGFSNASTRDNQLIAELQSKLLPSKALANLKGELGRAMGVRGTPIHGTILVDPKGNASPENAARVELSAPASKGIAAVPMKLARGAKTFTNEYVVFSTAMLFISMAHMNWDPKSNPNALEMWEKQSVDLVGAAGFAMFMLANHKVIHMMQAAKARRSGLPIGPPTSLMTYIGMSAGSLASSTFHEMWSDKDIWQCLRAQYDPRAKKVEGACERGFRTWVDGKKVMQYAPAILSMIGSTALAQLIRAGITKTGLAQKANTGFVKVVMNGARVFKEDSWAWKQFVKVGTGVPGLVVKFGDMILFLAMDTYVTAGPTNAAFAEVKANWFDYESFARDKLGFHSEFLMPKEGAVQPIDNAFDVEANSLHNSHWYMMEFYKRMGETGWQKPVTPDSCVPENIKELKKTEATKYKDNSWMNWFIRMDDYASSLTIWTHSLSWWNGKAPRAKSSAQLQCEVFARPEELVARYGEKNAEWRQTLLGHFSTAQNNWLTMIGNFNQTYNASYTLGKHIADAKFRVSKGLEQKPDLSREALAKVISMPIHKEGEDPYKGGHEEAANSWYLDGTGMRLPTPEMVDYVIAGLACGPDLVKTDAAPTQGPLVSRAYDQVYATFMQLVKSPTFISTPYGSSLRFVPPKMTSENRSICANIDQNVLKNIRYLMGDSFPAMLLKKVMPETNAKVVTNPFNGSFRDGAGKTYPSLAEYVFEKMDPQASDGPGNYSDFSGFWIKYMKTPIAPVWKNYEIIYQAFLREHYTPVLFNRDYRWSASCKPEITRTAKISDKKIGVSDPMVAGKKDREGFTAVSVAGTGLDADKQFECAGDGTAYRVANGVFLSIELELRNYLRGVFSLYMSTITDEKEKASAKQAYLALANQMIEDVKVVNPDDISSKNFDERMAETDKNSAALLDLVEARLKAAPPEAGNYRQTMFSKFKELITKISTEQKEYSAQFQRLDFGNDASMRAPVKNLGTPNSTNPLRRHGG